MGQDTMSPLPCEYRCHVVHCAFEVVTVNPIVIGVQEHATFGANFRAHGQKIKVSKNSEFICRLNE